ncbi:hypothetical protein HUG17_3310 [Dermatophagoides farinae]|uniref:C3H1-type domain-containing protein n=1 Tax=Dermatophagoides farinae TaxID=6954 RepID=A0A9D4SEP2_DERFA|nr:hypothetical protein HUG17_3310 [Dermatophagoides farinae]
MESSLNFYQSDFAQQQRQPQKSIDKNSTATININRNHLSTFNSSASNYDGSKSKFFDKSVTTTTITTTTDSSGNSNKTNNNNGSYSGNIGNDYNRFNNKNNLTSSSSSGHQRKSFSSPSYSFFSKKTSKFPFKTSRYTYQSNQNNLLQVTTHNENLDSLLKITSSNKQQQYKESKTKQKYQQQFDDNDDYGENEENLLDWLETELDQRGIDSIIYGRYLLSLLQQHTNVNEDSDWYDTSIGNNNNELDSGYEGSITTNNNSRFKQFSTTPVAGRPEKPRYCESHQRLYRGYSPSLSSSLLSSSQLNPFSLFNNRSPSSNIQRAKDNTQKAPSTTKWMHRRYRQADNKSPTKQYNRNNVNFTDDGNHNEQDGNDDFDDLMLINCPDCCRKYSGKKYWENDYRKFLIAKCLKSAIDKDMIETDLDQFIDEICQKYDQQHQQPNDGDDDHDRQLLQFSSNSNRNHSIMYNNNNRRFNDNDNENGKQEGEKDYTALKIKTTTEMILDQAKKYYDAFPALGGGGSAMITMTTSASASSSTSTSISSGSRAGSTNKMFIDNYRSHQSSFDDSVFIDNNNDRYGGESIDKNNDDQKGWNGKKIIRNIVEKHQPKLNLISTCVEDFHSHQQQELQNQSTTNSGQQSNTGKPLVVKLKSKLLGNKSRTANNNLIMTANNYNNDETINGKGMENVKNLEHNHHQSIVTDPLVSVSTNNMINNNNNTHPIHNSTSLSSSSPLLSAKELEKINQLMPSFLMNNNNHSKTTSTTSTSVSTMTTTLPKTSLSVSAPVIKSKNDKSYLHPTDGNNRFNVQNVVIGTEQQSQQSKPPPLPPTNRSYFNHQNRDYQPSSSIPLNNGRKFQPYQKLSIISSSTLTGSQNKQQQQEKTDDNVIENGHNQTLTTNEVDKNFLDDNGESVDSLLPDFLKSTRANTMTTIQQQSPFNQKQLALNNEIVENSILMAKDIDDVDENGSTNINYNNSDGHIKMKTVECSSLNLSSSFMMDTKIFQQFSNDNYSIDDDNGNNDDNETNWWQPLQPMMNDNIVHDKNNKESTTMPEFWNHKRRMEWLTNLWNRNCTLGYMNDMIMMPSTSSNNMNNRQQKLNEELSLIMDFVQQIQQQPTLKKSSLSSEEEEEKEANKKPITVNNSSSFNELPTDVITNNVVEQQKNSYEMNLAISSGGADVGGGATINSKSLHFYLDDDEMMQRFQRDLSGKMNNYHYNSIMEDNDDADNSLCLNQMDKSNSVFKENSIIDDNFLLPSMSSLSSSPSNDVINMTELINNVLESINHEQQNEEVPTKECFLTSLSIPIRSTESSSSLTNSNDLPSDFDVKQIPTFLRKDLDTTNIETASVDEEIVKKPSGPFSKRYKLKSSDDSVDSFIKFPQICDDNYINGHVVTSTSNVDHSTRTSSQQNWYTLESEIQNGVGYQEHNDGIYYYGDDMAGNLMDPDETHFMESYGNDLYNYDGYLINMPKDDENDFLKTSSLSHHYQLISNSFGGQNNFLTSSMSSYDIDGLQPVDLKFKLENRFLVPDNDTKPVLKPCAFYLENACARLDCKFSHDLSSIPCKYYLEGACYKEEFCPFLHEKPKSDLDQIDPEMLASLSSTTSYMNPKSSQFKIESDSDFPSLFEESRNTISEANDAPVENQRVNFLYKTTNLKPAVSSRKSPLQSDLKSNYDDDSTQLPNASFSSQNFAKCFNTNKTVKTPLVVPSTQPKEIVEEKQEEEEEWPCLSGPIENSTTIDQNHVNSLSTKSSTLSSISSSSSSLTTNKVISLKNTNNRNGSNFRDKVLMKSSSKKNKKNQLNNHSLTTTKNTSSSLKSIMNSF